MNLTKCLSFQDELRKVLTSYSNTNYEIKIVILLKIGDLAQVAVLGQSVLYV